MKTIFLPVFFVFLLASCNTQSPKTSYKDYIDSNVFIINYCKQKEILASNFGSGLIFSKNGEIYILTASHVVSSEGCDEQTIVVDYKRKNEESIVILCDIVTRSKEIDYALLKVRKESLHLFSIKKIPNVFLPKNNLEEYLGEPVYHIGNFNMFEKSITSGVISYIDRKVLESERPYIQSDISVGRGSSGGGLFLKDGTLIGIACKVEFEPTTAFFANINYIVDDLKQKNIFIF